MQYSTVCEATRVYSICVWLCAEGGASANANVVAAERELAGAGGLIELAARRLYDATQMHQQRRSVLAARAVRQRTLLILIVHEHLLLTQH